MAWAIFSALSTALGLHVAWLLTGSGLWTVIGGGAVAGGALLLWLRSAAPGETP